MQLLVEAYEIVSNAFERLKYDMYREKEVLLLYLKYHNYLKLMWNSKEKEERRRETPSWIDKKISRREGA